ncbi:nickel-responsive transcriptional regulator NikR [Herminiimonas arsenitoxidans]|uniref:nickel-responsive transcriptional regulator NikR n=1 Tax=Herminiimonas arsenitoxidans TaxID=1809410 RepID=UPI0009708A9C|nr:nickel-responsive transcriptional regulator NikR [Herminiimonas arsenitoxidans]
MKTNPEKDTSSVARISISILPEVLSELDQMVEERGYGSRSQAITDMVNQHLIEHKRQLGNEVMVGTITLFYDRSVPELQEKLSNLQYKHIDEVISSLHVHLTENKMMEVILVQGPTPKLQAIANSMTVLKGVITGRLQLMAAVIPQLHTKNSKTTR